MKILIVGQGYIGSYLTKHLIKQGHDLTVCSAEFGVPPEKSETRIEGRYQDIQVDVISSFEMILWFAGHSSVDQAVRDPSGAIRNNCFDLLQFAHRKPASVPLVYASTASLYSVVHSDTSNSRPEPCAEADALINSLNAYDSSKAAFDALVGPLAKNTCGLRLGTVCGDSPLLRPELIFNSMNISALRNGKVNVANRSAWRSLLFLEDLAWAIDRILLCESDLPRFINLASTDTQIGTLAETIAKWHKAEVIVHKDTPTYSFCMSTDLMKTTLGVPPQKSIEGRCRIFSDSFKSGEGNLR